MVSTLESEQIIVSVNCSICQGKATYLSVSLQFGWSKFLKSEKMSNEVSPESPPAYDSIQKDGSGIPIAGGAVPQTQQQQEYAEYCAQQNTQQPVVVNQLPEGAVIVEQQPQVVVMQQVGPNYCHFCKQHVSTQQEEYITYQ